MDFLEWLSGAFQNIVDAIFNILPTSPIVYLQSDPTISLYLGYVNFFVPIYLWISILEGWLFAIAAFYVVRVIMRWLKMAE